MNPEQQPQSRAKSCEDTIQELDEAIRLLNWQMSKIEVRVRRTLEWMNKVRLSTP
jgi:hypothetical protein